MDQGKVSLLDLCGICYAGKPKYCCPRCSKKTCSLSCVNTHKQRAGCNGKRDRAAYVEKSQLATPTGIDHDYNYLRSLELEIDNANRDTVERGIGTNKTRVFIRGNNPEGPLQRYLIANRINVIRAPTGMNRQRINKTRATKRGKIMWSVEWINGGGSRDLQESSLESSSLQDLYEFMLLEKRNAIKRGLLSGDLSEEDLKVNSKRRRVQDPEDDLLSQNSQPESPSADLDLKSGVQPDQARPDEKSQSDFFYLLKPQTPSRSRVLIPLPPHATLTECLRDRKVMEFPTIYVLSRDPASLPPGFVTEEDFLAVEKEAEQKAQRDVDHPPARPPEVLSKDIDPRRILDMLKRDMTR